MLRRIKGSIPVVGSSDRKEEKIVKLYVHKFYPESQFEDHRYKQEQH